MKICMCVDCAMQHLQQAEALMIQWCSWSKGTQVWPCITGLTCMGLPILSQLLLLYMYSTGSADCSSQQSAVQVMHISAYRLQLTVLVQATHT